MMTSRRWFITVPENVGDVVQMLLWAALVVALVAYALGYRLDCPLCAIGDAR